VIVTSASEIAFKNQDAVDHVVGGLLIAWSNDASIIDLCPGD
jgi:hypothetical protein